MQPSRSPFRSAPGSGRAQYGQAPRHALGGLAVRIAAQVLLVLGLGMRQLARALARQAKQFLHRGALGKFGLALQLGQDGDGLGIVVRSHGGARVGDLLRQDGGLERRVGPDALDIGQHLAGRPRPTGGGAVIPHGQPRARVIRLRHSQQAFRVSALLDGPRPQPVPGLAVDDRLAHVDLRLESLMGERDRGRFEILGL